MSEKTTDRAGRCISGMLRQAGLRPTRQRMALGQLLFGGHDRHVTAEILHAEAHPLPCIGEPRALLEATIRIDGADVQDPGGEPAGLTCRVYRRRDGRVSPVPDPADLRAALRRALTEAETA